MLGTGRGLNIYTNLPDVVFTPRRYGTCYGDNRPFQRVGIQRLVYGLPGIPVLGDSVNKELPG